MIWSVHACTGTNTANLSKPTASMNRSIPSTLPRIWQDINKSLDPTPASNWRLSSIKRYTSESRPSHPPLPSQPSSFHWMKVMTKLHCLMNFNLSNISKGESFSLCTRHEATGDISLHLCMPQNKSCHVVKQGYSYRVIGKTFNDLSCLQNSLPTWLSPSFALWQCCQLAVVHGMWKKMTGSFNYLSCSVISDNKYKIRREMIQQ
jgi:hypothetical protein